MHSQVPLQPENGATWADFYGWKSAQTRAAKVSEFEVHNWRFMAATWAATTYFIFGNLWLNMGLK